MLKFITLPNDRKIGDMVLKNEIPVPVYFAEGQKAEDLDVNSIIAGLIKVVANNPDNKNIAYYKEILLKMQPDAIKELNLASIAKSKKKEYPFALELMLAVKNLSDAPESYVNLAVLYAQMTVDCHEKKNDVLADQYDDSILEVLEQCKKKYPDYAPVYSEISAFHMRHGNLQQAREALETFCNLAPEGKEKSDARKSLAKMEEMLTSNDQILYAYDKMMMGLSDEAIEVIDTYLKNNKPCWEAYFIRGWANRALENFTQAQNDLLESLRLDGTNAEVYNELSLCAKKNGDSELAKSYLQIACDLDEDSAVYLTNLAFLHLQDNELEQAKEMIEKARAIDINDPELAYLMKEYTQITGEEFKDVISEEVYTDEQFEELRHHDKEHHEHHEEL